MVKYGNAKTNKDGTKRGGSTKPKKDIINKGKYVKKNRNKNTSNCKWAESDKTGFEAQKVKWPEVKKPEIRRWKGVTGKTKGLWAKRPLQKNYKKWQERRIFIVNPCFL